MKILPEQIMIKILKEISLPWNKDSDEWYILGYVLNVNSFYISKESGFGFDVLEFTISSVREIVSKVMYGDDWTYENENSWFSEWHTRMARLGNSGELQESCEKIERLIKLHPWITNLE